MQRAIGILGSTLGIVGGGLGLGSAALAAGCAANGGDESIVVLRNVVPTAGCVLTAMDTEVGISHGALDVTGATGYLFAAQLKSRITAVASQEDQRTIFVEGANVDIAFPGTTVFSAAELADMKAKGLTHFKAQFSTIISPNGGLSDVGFELIPGEIAIALAAKQGFAPVSADTSFTVLWTLAGGEVTSQTYHYPVTLMNGGFVHVTGQCSDLVSTFSPRVGNPCNPGQDGVVDCCLTDGIRMCPAVGTKM
jgi:hypothetical protein